MKASDLNKISIVQYLAQQNILPVKEKGNSVFYHSPLRVDNDPSFKVDTNDNVWYDFGLGKGGTMIDLVILLDKCTLYQAIVKLEQTDICTDVCLNIQTHEQTNVPTSERSNVGTDSFSFHGKDSISIQRITELVHPALLQYLDKRAININLAIEHCKQIHYGIDNRNYFAIGFKNDSDGWNLRNEYFKGCTSMNTSTRRAVDSSICIVFEGFMDYLSYLSMHNLKKSSDNIVVLNSTSNLSKAIDFIKSHNKVFTYLDNDEGGRKATELINQVSKTHFNKSVDFAKFKDLNEFLVSNKKVQIQERKPSRGFRL